MIDTMKYPFECVLCDTKVREIRNGRMVKNDEYNEVEFKLNTLSKMTTAVCSKHKNPKKSDFPKAEKKVKLGWQEEVDRGVGSREWVHNTGLKLKITGVESN